ncbi:MAG: hypothetical protein KJ061_02405 [Vicinamibacteraceae bacterium]|nr:hypothetical protein [Vicinamibacteraceae bacterium]
MSCRAARVTVAEGVERFAWTSLSEGPFEAPYVVFDAGGGAAAGAGSHPAAIPAAAAQIPPPPSDAEVEARLAALERDAFAKGYAQGERAGLEAGGKRAEAMLRRMAHTLDELASLRETMMRQTEQQLVRLALTLARRVVQREISQDPEIIAAIAHVALDKLAPSGPATIRLHPEDHAVVVGSRPDAWRDTQVRVVADPNLARGGCIVESDFGQIDASVEAQFGELTEALLERHEGLGAPGELPGE